MNSSDLSGVHLASGMVRCNLPALTPASYYSIVTPPTHSPAARLRSSPGGREEGCFYIHTDIRQHCSKNNSSSCQTPSAKFFMDPLAKASQPPSRGAATVPTFEKMKVRLREGQEGKEFGQLRKEVTETRSKSRQSGRGARASSPGGGGG